MAGAFVQESRSTAPPVPEVARLSFSDLTEALSVGWHHFLLAPSHAAFLALLYPLASTLLVFWTSENGAWQLLYPLVAGFVLLGPLAALPLYETSRRQERGELPSFASAMKVFRSPSLVSITMIGVVFLVIFTAWITFAQALYIHLFGTVSPHSMSGFLNRLLQTPEGHQLIVLGNLAGFFFAIAVLMIGFTSLPLLLDRDVGAVTAIHTSIRVALASPLVTAAWGIIVALLLLAGGLALIVGLAVVFPVLGHATWHLYRKAVPVTPVDG